MAKTSTKVPTATVALYEKLVATIPGLERRGVAMPYTSLNGNMFSFLTPKGTLALRLPAETRDALLQSGKATLCVQHGVVMKEYVEVPDALLKKTGETKKYFALSYEYAGTLKPKPTASKATAKKSTVAGWSSRKKSK